MKLAVSNATCELARIGQCFTEANKQHQNSVVVGNQQWNASRATEMCHVLHWVQEKAQQ